MLAVRPSIVYRSLGQAEADFFAEYLRLCDKEFPTLPQWPGLAWNNGYVDWAHTNWRVRFGHRSLKPFTVSRIFALHAPPTPWIEAVLHEIAHAACFIIGPHDPPGNDHGPHWKHYAILCGTPARARQPDSSFMPERRRKANAKITQKPTSQNSDRSSN